MHEHWERRPVGEIMPEEVVEKQIVSRLLGAVVVASIDHGADGRRLLLVLIIHHRHFPKTRMRVLGAGTDLALLSRLVIQRVWPDGRIVLGWKDARGIRKQIKQRQRFYVKIIIYA